MAGSFAEAAKVPRRVAVPVLRPALPYCRPTGVSLESGRRVAVMYDRGGAAEALVERLRTRGVDVLTLENGASAESLAERLAEWIAGGPVHGLFWLPALDAEGDLRSMDLAAFREALRVRVKNLYTSARALYEALGAPGTFLVSATRLGGRHGYDAAGAVAPLGGAVTGFTKAFKREKPEATVKAVDFGPDAAPSVVADLLIEETLRDPGCRRGRLRATASARRVGMRELPIDDGTPGMTLGKDSVFVVTGAAGSIVSAITTDLAAASGGTFHLLDLLPEPDPQRSRPRPLHDGQGRPEARHLRAPQGEGRAGDARPRREGAGAASSGSPRPSSRSAPSRRPAAPSTGTRATCATPRASARSAPRSSRRSPRVDVLLHGAASRSAAS